jgi:hypothetical protein
VPFVLLFHRCPPPSFPSFPSSLSLSLFLSSPPYGWRHDNDNEPKSYRTMRQLVHMLFGDKTSITLTTIDELTNHQRLCFRKLFRFPDYFSNQVLRAITRHRAAAATAAASSSSSRASASDEGGLPTVAGKGGWLRSSRSQTTTTTTTTLTLSPEDVASFWSGKIDQQDRATQCWHLLCDPALSQDFLFFDSIHDLLNDFVSAHQDLVNIRQSVEDAAMYVAAVSATIAFTLGCREHHKISRGEFCSRSFSSFLFFRTGLYFCLSFFRTTGYISVFLSFFLSYRYIFLSVFLSYRYVSVFLSFLPVYFFLSYR